MSLGSKLRFALFASSVIAGGGSAYAQAADQSPPAPDGDQPMLEDIVVTAEKRSASVQSVGIAITALDEAAVERLNARDLTTLTGTVPNLVYGQQGLGPGLAQISIRGINSQDVEKSFDPAVGAFIDGVYLGTSAFNVLDAFDTERVEVLRGPQGTLFGRNTTGGAISTFRTRPTGEAGGKIQLTTGAANRRDVQLLLNSPEFGGAWSLKVAGYSQQDDGIFENRAGGSTGAKERWGGTAALRFRPSDTFDAQITYDHAEDNSEIPPFLPASVGVPSPLPIRITQTTFPTPAVVYPALPADRFCTVPGGVCIQNDLSYSTSTQPHFIDAQLNALTGNFVWTPHEDYEFTAVIGWRSSTEYVATDYDGTPLDVFGVTRIQNYDQTSAELRVATNYDGRFNFIAGVFYFDSGYDLNQGQKVDRAMNLTPAPPLGTVYSNGAGSNYTHASQSTALFFQGNYELLDGLTLTAGLRATWDKKEIYKYIMGAIADTTAAGFNTGVGIPAGRPITSQGGGEADWFNLTPKLELKYRVTPDVMLYGSYSRGYNAGGFSGRAGTIADTTTPFDPEYVDAYEVGAKATMLNGRARVNAAFFVNQFEDKQEDSISPAPAPLFTSTTVRNASTAQMAGIELEGSFLLTDSLRLDGSFGYLNAEYKEFNAFLSSSQYVSTPAQPANTLIAADFSTLKPRHAPEFTGSITPSWTTAIGPGEFTVQGTARYTGERFVEFYNDPRGRVPGMTLIDASASFTFPALGGKDTRITLFGSNLTDERYIQNFTSSIVDLRLPAAPRTWGLSVQAKF